MRPAVDETENTEAEFQMLKGIIALLLSLARLCELASRAPHPVRCFVLWLMRRAESMVRDWVDGPADYDEYWPAAIRAGNEPADALRLAASLRDLAREVRKMAAEYRRFVRQCEREERGECVGAEHRHVVAKPRRMRPTRELLSRLGFARALPRHVLTPGPKALKTAARQIAIRSGAIAAGAMAGPVSR